MTCNIGRQHPGDWRTRAWRATLMRREVLLALDSELAQTNRGGTLSDGSLFDDFEHRKMACKLPVRLRVRGQRKCLCDQGGISWSDRWSFSRSIQIGGRLKHLKLSCRRWILRSLKVR